MLNLIIIVIAAAIAALGIAELAEKYFEDSENKKKFKNWKSRED